MMNKIFITAILLCSVSTLSGQTLDAFMENVDLYHPDICVARELLSAGEAESVTGRSPDNPKLNIGYFPGNDPAPGNKISWGISQSFDFPGRYARIKALKISNLELARMEFELTYLQIMSEVRLAAIEFIALKESRKVLKKRLSTMNRLETGYSKLLDNGETTIIEYNKIRLKQIELVSELTSTDNNIELLKTQLDYMSGNNSDAILNIAYPEFEEKEPGPLREQLRLYHPAFLIQTLRTKVADKAVKLSVSESMPAFELAYGSEIIATQRFTGPSLGVSVPLWKNKGMVKKSKADSHYQLKKAESEILYMESLYAGYFRSHISKEENITIVKEALEKANNQSFLDKALASGEIALTEYLLELGAVYELEDVLLKLTKENYLLLSKLNELDFSIN